MGVSVSIERLRVWLLVGVGLLVMVIAAFLVYAHHRATRFIKDLPAKLGADIRQETNAFTWSQTVEGRTVFTLHAAKAVQRKDGTYTLHDVGIVVYGRKQDRADRIYGKEFELDQNTGVVRAVGEVHIDLQAPAAADAKGKMDYASGKDLHGAGWEESGAGGERLIHVKTSGLVYLQKLGVAATDQEVEFEFRGMTGHAVGAEYSSDTGVLVLQSAVKMNGLQQGRPVVLTASRAEMDRASLLVTMQNAKFVSVGEKGSTGQQTAQAQRAVAHMRNDGSMERLEGEGDVVLTGADGGRVTSQQGEIVLNASNQMQSARLWGGVRYGADDPLRQATGEATEGRGAFDKVGRLQQVVLTGPVHVKERVRASETEKDWSERELSAATVELTMVPEGKSKSRLQDANASGNARLKVLNAAVKGGSGPTRSEIAGDVLTAHFVEVDGAQKISEAHGRGRTELVRVSDKGAQSRSSGDSLDVRFNTATAAGQVQKDGKGGGVGQGGQQIATAVQQGHLVMVSTPARKAGDTSAPSEQRATAEKAVYDGGTDRVTLTGGVQVSDAGSVLWADKMMMEQQSGDGVAEGSVKASYVQPNSVAQGAASGSQDVAHVTGVRAEFKRAADTAIFYGEAGRAARLWQGGSQVEAPVLQFEQKERRLVARGAGQGAPMAVHAVFVNSGAGKVDSSNSAKAGGTSGGKIGVGKEVGRAQVVRVASRELIYSDEARKAEFSGGVLVETADSRMRGEQATVYLQPAQGAGGKTASGAKAAPVSGPGGVAGGMMGGSVERIVATGQIEIEQTGRRATGTQLVYTASDGMFVLTGTAAAPPKVVDDVRGTVTGASLRFHSGDESVVVSNDGSSGAGQRVRTETQVKK
ncbi:lipopolysaccharide export system protein LptA [Edaphobacter aggregans]|uniref:Lipopolysaccharide export system protein LptA n=1 Tax=Edaphobacter aggregans TaxID=570835 RepID=A0A3R9NVY7_9BACT|nr:LptA/OstA family protein [Edaphobacter aggregans]RSL15849.1 lipopolysaccharide export system protein LptA [Edaphobacter aggregans]